MFGFEMILEIGGRDTHHFDTTGFAFSSSYLFILFWIEDHDWEKLFMHSGDVNLDLDCGAPTRGWVR